jgi:hypothetical protein
LDPVTGIGIAVKTVNKDRVRGWEEAYESGVLEQSEYFSFSYLFILLLKPLH